MELTRFVDGVVEKLERLDHLVNVIGGFAGGRPLYETDETTWDHMMDLNLRSVYLACRAAVPHLLRTGRCAIVNVASRRGRPRAELLCLCRLESRRGDAYQRPGSRAGPLTLQEHPPYRATRRPMPELSELVRNPDEHVARFSAWADAYQPAERSGAWGCAIMCL